MNRASASWQQDATSMPDDDRLEGDIRFFLIAGLVLLAWIAIGTSVVLL